MIFSYTESLDTLIISVNGYPERTKDDIEAGVEDVIEIAKGQSGNIIQNKDNGTVYKYVIPNINRIKPETIEKEFGITGVQDYMTQIENANITENTSRDVEAGKEKHRLQAQQHETSSQNLDELENKDKNSLVYHD